MISLTGILSLISVLIATSYALSCTQCVSPTSSSCSGDSVVCPSGEQCGSLYTDTLVIGGGQTRTFLRSCLPSSLCNVKGSISNGEGQVLTASTCCNTDDCTPDTPSLPTSSSDPNGVVCRSCSSDGSDWCYTADTINCTGNETMCFLRTTHTTGLDPKAIRGCATKSICDLGSQSQSNRGSTTEEKYICTSGGISVRTVVLTPPIACLLLLKWIF